MKKMLKTLVSFVFAGAMLAGAQAHAAKENTYTNKVNTGSSLVPVLPFLRSQEGVLRPKLKVAADQRGGFQHLWQEIRTDVH